MQQLLTDKAIKSAIAKLGSEIGSVAWLSDPSERGAGRLKLRIRRNQGYIGASWCVCWQRGKRFSLRLGSYPAQSLAEARGEFRQKYAPLIARGEDPTGPRAHVAHGKGTLRDLCEAYVDSLEGRPSQQDIRHHLLGPNGAANSIGANLPASSIRASHIVPYLAQIHERGAVSAAARRRSELHAAFAFGIKSANRYYERASARDWNIPFNPVAAIPPDSRANTPRSRALSEQELAKFWWWLQAHTGANKGYEALMLLVLTGQRPSEILRLRTTSYDRGEGTVHWETTKNGRPHTIPLPRKAVEILSTLTANEQGYFFPRRTSPDQPCEPYALARLVRVYIMETGAEPFEPRDLRRTWKTRCGQAGVEKSVRDRLQNHAKSDVSARHYDRYEYLTEMRVGMRIWEAYFQSVLDASPAPRPQWDPVTINRLGWIMAREPWRIAPQAHHYADWIGHAISEAFALPKHGDWRLKARRHLKDLIDNGIVAVAEARDHKSRLVPTATFVQAASVRNEPNKRLAPTQMLPAATPERLARLSREMGTGTWRSAPQALRHNDWIGNPIARAFDLHGDGWKTTANRISFRLQEDGWLDPIRMEEPITGRILPGVEFKKYLPEPTPELPKAHPVQPQGTQLAFAF